MNHLLSRRDFVKRTAGAAVAVSAISPSLAFAAGSDRLKVGLIGCGGRGTGALLNLLEAAPGIDFVAMGDLFPDRVASSLERINDTVAKKELPTEAVQVPPERQFSGFDAYQKVLDCDPDLVILAAPPHFRPRHFEAAVEAGKHVFMEKPVAVDPAGIRKILELAGKADQKGLRVVAGTQRRHQQHYLDIMERIRDGAIGEIVAAQCYWNMGALWVEAARNNLDHLIAGDWTPMEYQIRNWLFHVWLSGDHIVEQHVHNIDVVNWSLDQFPRQAMGVGGRQARTQPQYGNIFDHFAVEFEYANGLRTQSMCCQIEGSNPRVEERIVGTKGTAVLSSTSGRILGPRAYEAPESPNPYVQEHADLVRAIRQGEVLNEAYTVARSTASAILGRMSAYTGRMVGWDWMMNASELDYTPEAYAFGTHPVQPVAIPGTTPLVQAATPAGGPVQAAKRLEKARHAGPELFS